MMPKEPCFDDLDFEKSIYCLVSGGRDSTAMALGLWDYCHFYGLEPDIKLVFGDTRVNMGTSRKTLSKLEKLTKFPLIRVRYEGTKKAMQILNESFANIPKAIEIKEYKGGTYKKVFPCCDLLKKRPMKKFFSSLDPENIILLLGIKKGDKALHRKYRLNQLRALDTYYRRHKSNNLLYYYPLRDLIDSDIDTILKRYSFSEVHSSGCTLCPIFCVTDWKDKDPETYRKSRDKAKSLGIDLRAENQQSLEPFCKDAFGGFD